MTTRGSIFVLTGAGISAESGIPVFQGTSWRGHSHYELANIEAWERTRGWFGNITLIVAPAPAMPSLMRRICFGRVGKRSGAGVFLCTQNVDGLHEAAGSEDVVHIHGKLFESRCAAGCGRPAFADCGYTADELPHCACGALVRPNVCWFGEQPYHLDRI